MLTKEWLMPSAGGPLRIPDREAGVKIISARPDAARTITITGVVAARRLMAQSGSSLTGITKQYQTDKVARQNQLLDRADRLRSS